MKRKIMLSRGHQQIYQSFISSTLFLFEDKKHKLESVVLLLFEKYNCIGFILQVDVTNGNGSSCYFKPTHISVFV